MKLIYRIKKPIAFVLTLALLFGSMGLTGVGTEEVYAGTPADDAKVSLLKAVEYYSSDAKNWDLTNWEELLAIYGASKIEGTGVDVRQWELPGVPNNTVGVRSYLPQVITSLILGLDPTSYVNSLLSDTDSRFSIYPDVQAYGMLAVEIASNAGIEIPSTSYSALTAATYLAGLQNENGGFSGEYDGGLVTADTSGYVALAIAPYANTAPLSSSVGALVSYLQNSQNATKGYYTFYGSESPNSTAVVIWGLSAIKAFTTDDTLKSVISGIQSKALPSLTKWQNEDGSFWASYLGEGTFDSFTSRQIMIALYEIASGQDLFREVIKTSSPHVSRFARIESDAHLPVSVTISPFSIDTPTTIASLAWSKGKMSGGFPSSDYIIPELSSSMVFLDSSVTTRSAFSQTSIIGQLNQSQTITLLSATTLEPLAFVPVTIDGSYVGYESVPPYGVLKTDLNGQLTIPGDKFLTAKTYQISTSAAGISKDLCNIKIQSGGSESRTVSVRIEGINSNILNEEVVTVTTSGINKLTAYDAITEALSDLGIPYTIYGGWIASIGAINDNTFGLTSWDYDYWNFIINGNFSGFGINSYVIEDGDEILLYYGNGSTSQVEPTTGYENGALTVSASGISGATVTLSGGALSSSRTGKTNASGVAVFGSVDPGIYTLQIEKYSDTISSGGLFLPLVVRLAPNYQVKLYQTSTLSNNTPLDLSSVSSNSPQEVTVNSEVANPEVKLPTSGGLPEIRVKSSNTNNIEVLIPQGTTITAGGSGWDGTLALPRTTSLSLTGKTISSAIVIGSTSRDFTFDKPVRILLPGAATKKVGSINAAGTFEEITQSLTFDTTTQVAEELTSAGKTAGKLVSGNDLVVWTKHFSTFVTYTDSSVPGGSSPAEETATLRVIGYNGSNATTILSTKTIEIENDDTPITLLGKAGLSYRSSGGYISEIEGLEEKEYGEYSGWKFSVNGSYPSVGASSVVLKNGDAVVWNYVTSLDEEEERVPLEEPSSEPISEGAIKLALAQFADLNGTEWYATAAGFLAAKGILTGKPGNLFDPSESITRAELAMMLAKASGADLTSIHERYFQDVTSGHWFASAVNWAKEQGFVSGYQNKDGTYKYAPNEKITRQDIALMIYRFQQKALSEETAGLNNDSKTQFSDQAAISPYAKDAVLAMRQAGILNGVKNSDGTYSFQPQRTATRAEAAVMVYQMLNQ